MDYSVRLDFKLSFRVKCVYCLLKYKRDQFENIFSYEMVSVVSAKTIIWS
jgi:hypothetical protein